MKMWHKLLLIIACLSLLAFSACGEKAPASPSKKEQTDAPQKALLSEEELSQIGKAAVEKWATIGYIVSEPLYNTALSQLGQNELREIYSAHIYASGLESSWIWVVLKNLRVSTSALTLTISKTTCRRAALPAMKSGFILTAAFMLHRPICINIALSAVPKTMTIPLLHMLK